MQVAGEAFNDSPDAFDRRLIDAVPIAVVVCDREGAVVRANARTTELLGRAPVPGERFRDVVRLLDADGSPLAEEDCPVSRVLRTETPSDQSLCLERTDGSRVAVRVTAEPLRDQHGSTIGAIATIQDAVADTHRATLAAIVDSSDDAIVSKTLDGVVTSWNRGAERIFGYTAEEAVGRHISLIIPTDRLAEESEVLARLGRGERIDHFETVRRTKSGRLIDISLTVSPVLSSDGRIIGASKVARDITERNSTHRALGRSQRRYRRLFDSAGVSLWELDFSAVKSAVDDVRRRNDVTFREYLRLHPDFVTHCVGLVRVVDINHTTLRMFGARSKSDLMNGLGRMVDESALAVFADGLAAIAEGRTVFEGEVALLTLAGARLDAMLSLRFPQGENPRDPDGSFDSVLVSLTDITERRKAEDAVRGEIQIRETLANVGASLAAELDPDRLVQAVTDAATHLTSAETGAFFYNVTNESGESYQLHALAGASLTEGGRDSSALAPPLFAQAFRGRGHRPNRRCDEGSAPRGHRVERCRAGTVAHSQLSVGARRVAVARGAGRTGLWPFASRDVRGQARTAGGRHRLVGRAGARQCAPLQKPRRTQTRPRTNSSRPCRTSCARRSTPCSVGRTCCGRARLPETCASAHSRRSNGTDARRRSWWMTCSTSPESCPAGFSSRQTTSSLAR